jgi:F0F1-type ATP synthase epsilon subunit
LHLRVWTPSEIILDIEHANWANLELADGGGIGIRPGHAPLLAETLTAPMDYQDESGEHLLFLEAGILHIEPSSVTVLTNGLASVEDSEERPSEEETRFDRLARVLFTMLSAQPGDSVDVNEKQG